MWEVRSKLQGVWTCSTNSGTLDRSAGYLSQPPKILDSLPASFESRALKLLPEVCQRSSASWTWQALETACSCLETACGPLLNVDRLSHSPKSL